MPSSPDKIAQLQQIVAADPGDDLAFFMLGSELLRVRRYPEAAAAFEASMSLKPIQPAAARLLGDAHRLAENIPRAIAAYELAVELSESTGDLQVAKEARAFLKRLTHPPTP